MFLTLISAFPPPASAQDEDGAAAADPTVRSATPFVPRGHWSLDAARRLEGAGLTDPGFDPGTATHTLGELQALFDEAVERAVSPEIEGGVQGLRELAAGYRDRFREEFPEMPGAQHPYGRRGGIAPDDLGEESPGDSAGAIRWLGGALAAGYRRETGRVLAGDGYGGGAWTGARPLPDVSRPTGELRILAGLGARVAGSVTPALDDGLELREGHLAVGVGPATFWAGRRTFRFGATDRGGLVYAEGPPGDAVFLDGGGVSTGSFRLPWILRYLGPFRAEASVTVVDANGEYEHPWMVSVRGRVAPHPRLSFGVNRGAMYGGEGNEPLSWHKTLVRALFGVRPGLAHGYDNQVVSVDARYRPPLGDLPLVLYGEWGAEDSSGGYKDVPAMLGGIEVTAMPGFPELSLGVDATRFSGSCCGNPSWYRHGSFTEGWSEEGRLFGQPLGGHGSEIRIFGGLALLNARLRVRGEVFSRDRRPENVFSPQRSGESRGVAMDADLRIAQSVELSVSAFLERGEDHAEAPGGDGWDQGGMRGTLRWFF